MTTVFSRSILNFNNDWEFQLSTLPPNSIDWHSVTLPHDWSISCDFSNSYDGATGYLPGGTGWYRKVFKRPLKEMKSCTSYLLFDGIYNRATVYLNGTKLHYQPNGYVPFFLNISEHLEDSNELLIMVDHERYIDSRWYTGSGIYRDVELILCHSTHVPVWGNVVTAAIQPSGNALISQRCQLICDKYTDITVKSHIVEYGSNSVVAHNSISFTPTSTQHSFEQEFDVELPRLWAPDTPNLYTVISEIYQQDESVDKIETQFGIRTLDFDADTGFFLNGQPFDIKGVCLHQDGGLVGTAVPDIIWKQRLIKLKECGVNAIRIAHHPAAKNILNICDQLGLLVQDEFFDEWHYPKDKRLNMGEQHDDFFSKGASEFFTEYAETDLKNTIRSHINHPSIFMWSIGNEIEWTYPRNVEATGFFDVKWDGNYFWSLPPNNPKEITTQLSILPEHQYNIGETANQLSLWTREIDPTRPITANCILPSVSYLSGYADALDVIGFSYRRVIYDYGHELYPYLPIIGNENLPRWHDWKAVCERDFVSGLFLWTGVDYMGETHNQWPTRIMNSGLLDITGRAKPAFHLYKTLWTKEPHVYMHSALASARDVVVDKASNEVQLVNPDSWERELWIWPKSNEHWNYNENDVVLIEAFTNCEKAELFLNNRSLGLRTLSEAADKTMRWAVPFEEGLLEILAYSNDSITAVSRVFTALSAATLSVEIENYGEELNRLVRIKLNDSVGVPVKHTKSKLNISLSNGSQLVGVGNGAVDNTSSHRSSVVDLYNGEALILLTLCAETKSTIITLDCDLGIQANYNIQ